MLKNSVRYPANSAPPNPLTYPFGSAVNSTAPGAKNGYPYEKDQINDWLGFSQGMVSWANITPSGNPDTAFVSDMIDSFQEMVGVTHIDVAAVIADETLKKGALVRTKDRIAGVRGGGSPYLIKDGAEVSADNDAIDTFGNHALTKADTFMVIQPVNGAIDLRAYGITGTADSDAFLAACTNQTNLIGDPDLIINLEKQTTLPQRDLLRVDLRGGKFTSDGGYVAITNLAPESVTSVLIADAVRGTHIIPLANSTEADKFATGDLVQVRSDKLWYFDNRGTAKKGETHVVSRVSGSTVIVEAELFDTYENASETINLVKIDKSTFLFSNFFYENPINTTGGIQFQGQVDSRFDYIDVDGATGIGMLIKNSYKTQATMGSYRNANTNNLGYGIQISQSTFSGVIGADFYNNRRGVDISGADAVSRGCYVGYCKNTGVDLDHLGGDLYSFSSGFGTHGSSDGSRFFQNQTWDVKQGIITRGANESVLDNFFYGRMSDAVASTDGANLTIQGNRYESSMLQASPVSGDSRLQNFVNLTMYDNRGRTVIKDNTANRIVSSFLQYQVDSAADNLNVKGIDMSGNTWNIFANSVGASFTNVLFVAGGGHVDATLKSCRFINNSGVSLFGAIIIPFDAATTISITELEPCAVEGLPLINAILTGPTITASTIELFCDLKNNKARIYGRVSFTLSGPGQVKLGGFPDQKLSILQAHPLISYGNGVVTIGSNSTGGNIGVFFLSSDLANPVGNLAVGTHPIEVNFTYERNVERNFDQV